MEIDTDASSPNRPFLCLCEVQRSPDRLFRCAGHRAGAQGNQRRHQVLALLHGTPRRRVTLGRYPSLYLAAARARAIEVREGRSAGTVAALAETYLRSISGLRSRPEIERRLRRDVLPIIGHVPLDELHRRDVTRVIDAKLTNAPITARRVFEDIRAMVRWAVSRGDLDHSPIDGLRGPAISKPRTRTLADPEIRAVWHGLY